MTFAAMISMMRDRGLQDYDEIGSIIGYFDGYPATEFTCDVWPVDRADPNLKNRPRSIDFKRRRKDAL